MNGFIGCQTELGLLDDLLHPVKTGGRSGRPVPAVLIRGRRRVGKSRLVEEVELLTTRRMVAADLPLSTRPSREIRYRIDDPYLRFWLSFIGPGIPAVERGRGDRVLDSIRASWTSWRGRAIEPVIREALWRLADDRLPEDTHVVGGHWTRTNDPEIDLVGVDCSPIAKKITFAGSIKWLENKPCRAATSRISDPTSVGRTSLTRAQ